MTPLLSLADAELAQLIATAALLPVEKRGGGDAIDLRLPSTVPRVHAGRNSPPTALRRR
jgi:hypothetical protein